MGKRGSEGKPRSIRFKKWMSDAIAELAQECHVSFTAMVIELLRRELNSMGYTMGIGREAKALERAKEKEEEAS